MKTIDLLNKMANDKNYRPTVKFLAATYKYNEEMEDYKSNINSDWGIFSDYTINNILNDEVEVIEENKEIEELKANAYIEPNTLNEYRSCFAYGQKGLFHRWIIKHDVIYKDEYVKGLVEFENGHVAEVGIEDIQFCDNKIKGYDFKEREEK